MNVKVIRLLGCMTRHDGSVLAHHRIHRLCITAMDVCRAQGWSKDNKTMPHQSVVMCHSLSHYSLCLHGRCGMLASVARDTSEELCGLRALSVGERRSQIELTAGAPRRQEHHHQRCRSQTRWGCPRSRRRGSSCPPSRAPSPMRSRASSAATLRCHCTQHHSRKGGKFCAAQRAGAPMLRHPHDWVRKDSGQSPRDSL